MFEFELRFSVKDYGFAMRSYLWLIVPETHPKKIFLRLVPGNNLILLEPFMRSYWTTNHYIITIY